ncbi:unnamed protein product [Ilex paraguariensis]|uniref:Auxin-responsive protein n=1 Tax=Ilex paraguariensis TaxID=185542 RepID=A0ABC8TLP7_9AQUA
MELELGLAPPTQSRPMVGFDLNNVFKPNEMVRNGCSLEIKHYVKDKNTSAEAFEQERIETETSSVLMWNGQPNEEDDERRQKRRRSNTIIKRSGEEDHHLMGWPPIKSWRGKLYDGHQGCRIATHWTTERGSNRTNSTYIKVKMEGVAIGRKIDLQLHHSYQTLANSLINMFVKSK